MAVILEVASTAWVPRTRIRSAREPDARSDHRRVLELESESGCEALEESGCHVEVGRLTGLYLSVDAALLLLVYRATSTTALPQPDPADEDALEAGWFPASDALGMVTHPGEHQRLADVLADHPEVVYRVVKP
jgi:hypothetical protein